MTTAFLISSPLTPVSTSLHTLSVLLDLTERRVQQLVREGIVVRKKPGCYDLIASLQGYVRYLRAQAQKKAPVSEEELEKALACLEIPSDLL